jgi:molybdopterin synthase sulfur carrier subunit
MKVEIRLFAGLRKYSPREVSNNGILDIPHGCTVGDILALLEILEDVKKIIFINGVHGTEETLLNEHDRVGIFPPVAGG